LIEVIDLLLDFEYVIYTTHKHHEEKERFRIVIPLNKKVDEIQYQALGRKIAESIDMNCFDDTTYDYARLMYFPSTSKDGEFKFEHKKGERLDVDFYLNQYEDYKDKTTWPTSSREHKIINLENKKQQNPLEKEGVIGAFCRAYNIHEAIEKYLNKIYLTTENTDRYTYINGTTSGGLVVYEDGLFAYSYHSSDPCKDKLCNAFDLVKNHYFKKLEEKEALVKMIELVSTDSKVLEILLKQSIENAKNDFNQEENEEIKEINEEVKIAIVNNISNVIEDTNNEFDSNNEDVSDTKTENKPDINWITKLQVNKKGKLLNTINNIVLILENDKKLKNKIALNEFSHHIAIIGKLPWESQKEVWSDSDDSNLRHYLETIYNIKSKDAVYDAITVVASKHSFHPIREYLNRVTWDGVERIETLFIDYLGAKDTYYTRQVSRKILAAAVNRVFEPGVKFDHMPVFVGKEGIGKSQILDKLGKDWYSDSINTVLGKEAYEQLQGAWIIEMAELSAVKKAETEAVKHFVSKREDIYRVAYGRRVEKFKRQCVFFGTTNEESFLKDKNGNRRFWPIKVGENPRKKIVGEDLTNYERDNIWAEAVILYKQKEGLELTGEAAKTALEKQKQHLEESPKEGMISEYLEMKLPKNWSKMDIPARRRYLNGDDFCEFEQATETRVKVCAMEVWVELFNGDPKQLTPINAREINDIIRRLPGWKSYDTGSGKMRFGSFYGPQKAFVREEDC
ncbi:VapE domain-containing protein, partial [Romboutsia sp.]|uniref:VapE domain-containing protein n=1 Tax=Romboutsia sp. TaxID=1965302 RepID=UPI003F3EE503